MCMVCALWNLGKITTPEARKALGEMVNTKSIDKEHTEEVKKLLDEAEKDNQ